MKKQISRVLVVRHGEKGNGENAPKDHLSPKGEQDALEFGRNLPACMNGKIDFVGGSVHFRSGFTAQFIARGANTCPQTLESRMELGSEPQLWSLCDMENFMVALKSNNNAAMTTMRTMLYPVDYQLLKNQILNVVKEFGEIGGNIVLGSHNPWVQLLLEAVTGVEININCPELGYVVVDVYDDGSIELVESSLPAE